MEFVSLKDVPKETKIRLLEKLGLSSDGLFVLDAEGKRVRDKYVDVDVILSNMLLFPGSVIVLDDNPLSIAAYLEDFPDMF